MAFTGLSQYFKCNIGNGKVVLPESFIISETEFVRSKGKSKELSASEGQYCGGEHEEAHRSNVQSQEREMLKNAKIETQALDQDKQKQLLQKYKQQQVERRREENSQIADSREFERNEQERRFQEYEQKQLEREESLQQNTGSSAYHPPSQQHMAPGSTKQPQVPVSQALGLTHRNDPASAYSSNSLPRPSKNNRIYDQIPERNGQQLRGQRSVQDERMLGHHSNSAHDLLSQQSNLSPQPQAPQPSASAAQPSPGGVYHEGHNFPNQNYGDNQEKSPDNLYANLPLDNQQPTDEWAIAPPPQGHASLNLNVNSAVHFSDPPRYGVIRWMGTLSGITGQIAGVELVSFTFPILYVHVD